MRILNTLLDVHYSFPGDPEQQNCDEEVLFPPAISLSSLERYMSFLSYITPLYDIIPHVVLIHFILLLLSLLGLGLYHPHDLFLVSTAGSFRAQPRHN